MEEQLVGVFHLRTGQQLGSELRVALSYIILQLWAISSIPKKKQNKTQKVKMLT